jgi:hypothetical protein
MKKWIIFIITLFYLGCFNTSYQQKMCYPALSQELVGTDSISFITIAGDQYKLGTLSLSPQEIQGDGKMKNRYHSWEEFSGTVPLDSISLILSRQSALGRVVAIGTAAILIGSSYDHSRQGSSDPELKFSTYQGGSSCPFIYSKTDTGYCLEAEAFGTALGKAMEIETSSCLPALSFNQSDLQIRLSNERFETQYVNSVSLAVVIHPADAMVVLDNARTPWLVSRPQKPLMAVDHSGKNITALVDSKDSGFWESDLANTTFNSGLQDYIELKFERPADGKDAALIVDAINTGLITSVYHSVFNFLGEDALLFLHKLETDSTIISLMQNWLQDCALHIFVWNNERWEPCGFILPEANAVPFQRLVHLQMPESGSTERSVKIMLSSLPDVWKINSITVDWKPQQVQSIQPVRLSKAAGPGNSDQTQNVLHNDQGYAVLLPGESIDLVFEKNKFRQDQTVTPLIAVRGYLHEWLIEDKASNAFSFMGNILGHDRVSALTYLMKDKRLLLPPIYADWKKYKTDHGVR